MRKFRYPLIALLLVFLFVGCGGDDDDNVTLNNGVSADGTWLAGDVVFTGEGDSGTMPNFRIIIDGNQIRATADDDETGAQEWWNWGPVAFTQNGNNIVVQNIPEVEGGDTVRLSMNLTVESATLLTGTATIDWWIAEQNNYWPSVGTISATQ